MKKAFMFAGQGAQVVGMAKELQDNTQVQQLFAMAKAVCPEVVKIMFEGPQELLNQTLYTQPAMYLADLAYAYAEAEKNGKPDAVLGFSVGEVPALAFANAFSVEDGLKIILKRAELMENYTKRNAGSMIAVLGLESKAVEALCDGENNQPANYNGAKQTVVACKQEAEADFLAKVKAAGGRAMKLKVSGMFHCKELAPESEAFATFLKEFSLQKPQIPVYANLTAKPYSTDIVETLSKQMSGAVRFTETIANMRADGITEFVEVGAGKVLTGLVAKG